MMTPAHNLRVAIVNCCHRKGKSPSIVFQTTATLPLVVSMCYVTIHIVSKLKWQVGMSSYKFRCCAFNVFASLSNDLKVWILIKTRGDSISLSQFLDRCAIQLNHQLLPVATMKWMGCE